MFSAFHSLQPPQHAQSSQQLQQWTGHITLPQQPPQGTLPAQQGAWAAAATTNHQPHHSATAAAPSVDTLLQHGGIPQHNQPGDWQQKQKMNYINLDEYDSSFCESGAESDYFSWDKSGNTATLTTTTTTISTSHVIRVLYAWRTIFPSRANFS